MSNNSRTISIRVIISIIFVVALLLSTISIGLLVFNNWRSSAASDAKNISSLINDNIYDKTNSFMRVPLQMNEIYHDAIESDLLDLTNDVQRDRFFVSALRVHSDEVYSFSYGAASGEYYGARRNAAGIIEIMRNDVRTGGQSWYYAVNEDITAGELVVQAGDFDPRTRAWYQKAEETGSLTLSPVYKHFVMDDLTISAAWPVFDDQDELQGVLGAHMLLSGIGSYLQEVVHQYNGYAFIVEEETHVLIANSMNLDNFTVMPDGLLHRQSIDDIDDNDIEQAYENYKMNQETDFLFQGENDNFYVSVRELEQPGISWLVVSAVPQSIFMSSIRQNILWTILLVGLVLILFVLVYNSVMRKMLKPMNHLLQVSEALSSGDLSQRVTVSRNDEIGIIAKSMNQVADKMQYLINDLEKAVRERTEDLYRAKATVEEGKNRLQLILDSTAEAIYGVDLQGNCTFCNASCIKVLGYSSQEELLGKNMHNQIHHSHRDGTKFPAESCRILLSIQQRKGYSADDEVFWRADDTFFDVEYHSYPQIVEEKIVGGVINFFDITDRKKKEEEIYYLNCYDILTGLYNRRCFEDNIGKFDIEENLPLSVIFADINGLKMTNDIFGHAAGDKLIKKTSEILVKSCREEDIVARVGGDEFIILLPNTTEKDAEMIIARIRTGFVDARIAAIKCSISLGYDTKNSSNQSLVEMMANAENEMYRDKTMNRKSNNREIIDTIVETLHAKSAREKRHSESVGKLCRQFGSHLQLSEPEINQLVRAGYLHDIGKITLDDSHLLNEYKTNEDLEEIEQHPIIGYRILNLFDDTLDLAEYVYSHHERWDGAGFPRGIKGEQIPRIARIISVVETYERVLNRGDLSLEKRKIKAIDVIKENAGTRFDPQIARSFAQMMAE